VHLCSTHTLNVLTSTDATDFNNVERELKRCVKSKLWSPIENSGATTQPAVYFEINNTAEKPNEHNSKTWWFAFDRRMMCGLAAALTGIDLSYCVPLKKMVINAQSERLKEVHDVLLALLAFLRIRKDHAVTPGPVLEIMGLDNFRTALLLDVITSEAVSREAITMWLKVVRGFGKHFLTPRYQSYIY